MSKKPKKSYNYDATVDCKKMGFFYGMGGPSRNETLGRLEQVVKQVGIKGFENLSAEVIDCFRRYRNCKTAVMVYENEQFGEVEIRVTRILQP